jgi:hypothetical protein
MKNLLPNSRFRSVPPLRAVLWRQIFRASDHHVLKFIPRNSITTGSERTEACEMKNHKGSLKRA